MCILIDILSFSKSYIHICTRAICFSTRGNKNILVYGAKYAQAQAISYIYYYLISLHSDSIYLFTNSKKLKPT